jgi:uncharacterized protein YfkK (UPF0435 family)
MEPVVNENVKQPTYEELAQAYQQVSQQLAEYQRGYQVLVNDKTIEKLKAICSIIEHKESYSDKVQKLADWHLQQILAKPAKA